MIPSQWATINAAVFKLNVPHVMAFVHAGNEDRRAFRILARADDLDVAENHISDTLSGLRAFPSPAFTYHGHNFEQIVRSGVQVDANVLEEHVTHRGIVARLDVPDIMRPVLGHWQRLSSDVKHFDVPDLQGVCHDAGRFGFEADAKNIRGIAP